MAGYDPSADFAPGLGSAAAPSQPHHGWSWNPLTDVQTGLSSIGNWVNKHTQIGDFNPGVGSAVQVIGGVVPGLINLGISAGTPWNPTSRNRLKDFAKAMGEGATNTATDVLTVGGLAPYTNALEQYQQDAYGYRPQSWKQQATNHQGQGFLGAGLNDLANISLAAGGVGAAAKAGTIGEAAEAAIGAGTDAQLEAINSGAQAADIGDASSSARQAYVAQRAAEIAAAGGDGVEASDIAQRITDRAKFLDRLNTLHQATETAFNPFRLGQKLLSPFGRAASEQTAQEAVSAQEGQEGSHQAAGAPATPETTASATEAAPKTGEAVWHNGETDQPVTVEGSMGAGPDGREYLRVSGSKTGVPADEITFKQPAGVGARTAFEQARDEAVAHVESQVVPSPADVLAQKSSEITAAGQQPVTLYRGQPEGPLGNHWTQDINEARTHAAASGGQVFATVVPSEEAALAQLEGRQLGDFGASGQGSHYLSPPFAVPYEGPTAAAAHATGQAGSATADAALQELHNLAQHAGEPEAEGERTVTTPTERSGYRYFSQQTPAWAKRLVAKMPPSLVHTLAWLDGLNQRHYLSTMTREQERFITAEAKRVYNLPEIQQSIGEAKQLISNAGLSPNAASRAIGERVLAAAAIGPLWHALEDRRVEADAVDPGFTNRILRFQQDLPPEINTPDFRQRLQGIADRVADLRKQNLTTLRDASRIGDRGLEDVESLDPVLTAKERGYLKEAQRLLKEEANLQRKNIPRELSDANRRLLLARDDHTKLLRDLEAAREAKGDAINAIDRSRRYVPLIARTDDRYWAALEETARRTAADQDMPGTGGATLNPHTGQFIEPGEGDGYLVGAIRGTADVVPEDAWLQVNPETGRTLGAEALDRTFRAYQNAYGYTDMMLGTWRQGGQIHIDPSQLVQGRDNALILASAREQDALFALRNGETAPANYNPNIAMQFIDRHAGRDARGTELRTWADQQTAEYQAAVARGETPATPPLDQRSVDDFMAVNDAIATTMSRTRPDLFPHPDDYYRQGFKYEGAIRPSQATGALNQIRLMVRDPEQLGGIVREMIQSGGTEHRWYFDQHDFIEQRGANLPDVQLGLGTPNSVSKVVSGKELLYNLTALMSVNASPDVNWMWAVGGLRNFFQHVGTKDLANAVDEWTKLPIAERMTDKVTATSPKLLQLLAGRDVNQLAKRMFFAVLDGHTIDTWDRDFLRNIYSEYGKKTVPALSEKNIPQELIDRMGEEGANMEFHGSNAQAKIRSFFDNLHDPANSTAVTLDAWMARLFGEQDTFWSGKTYSQYADLTRQIAQNVGAQLKRTVMPHEVQAALWFYAKRQFLDLNAAVHAGAALDTIAAIDNGDWSRITDPLGELHRQLVEDAGIPRSKDEPLVQPKNVRISKEVAAGNEQVVPGSPVEEQPVMWRRTGAKTNKAGEAVVTDEGKKILTQAANYAKVQDKVEAALAAGDNESAKQAVIDFVDKKLAEVRKQQAGKSFGEAASLKAWPAVAASTADATGVTPGELAQVFGNRILGQFVPKNETMSGVIRLFQGADISTLFHEHAHLARMLMNPDDLAMFERTYGVEGGRWTTEAEEAVVHDFLAGRAQALIDRPELNDAHARLRDTLRQVWEPLGDSFLAHGVHPEIADYWNRMLTPVVGRSDVTSALVGDQRILGMKPLEQPNENLSLLQRLRKTPEVPNETLPGMYRRGREGQAGLAQYQQAQAAEREILQRMVRAQSHVQALEDTIANQTLPSQVQAAALRGKAANLLRKVDLGMDDPSQSRAPAVWQPFTDTARKMAAEVKDHPEMETILSDLPKTFGQALGYALDNGFDPAHVRDFTPTQVRNLAYGTAKLGASGKDYGQEFVAGTRKGRTGFLRSANLADRSIEAIAAGLVEATHEDRTNHVVDFIDRNLAVEIPRDPETGLRLIPRGWRPWDPVKRSMLSTEAPQGGEQALGATMMIRKEVAQTIKAYSGDFNNPLARGLAKITNPWRALVLTLSPKFYLNHMLGHMVLATAGGALRLSDWTQAWQAAKKDEFGNRFSTVPGVQGQSIVRSELGGDTFVNWPSLSDAMQQGGVREVTNELSSRLHNVVNTADSFSRAAVYFSQLRKGADEITALNYASHALVDYGDLTSVERNIVRSVVPFYSFEKGILKILAHYPLDHPVAANLLMQIGHLQEKWAVDKNGNPLPSAYQDVVHVPGLGAVNTKSLTPFKDAAALVTPDGIVGSLQFAIQALVRSGLNTPAPGTKTGVKVGPTGALVPDVSLTGQLANTLTSTPQGSLFAGLTGSGTKTPGQAALSFLGVPTVSQDILAKAGTRLQLSQGESTLPTATIQKAVTSQVDQRQLMQALAKATPGTGLAPSGVFPAPPTQPTTDQVQAAQTGVQQSQQAAALTRAANGTNRRTTTRRRSSGGGGSGGIKHFGGSGRIRTVSASHRSSRIRVSLRRGFASHSRSSGHTGGMPHFRFKPSTKGVPGLKSGG